MFLSDAFMQKGILPDFAFLSSVYGKKWGISRVSAGMTLKEEGLKKSRLLRLGSRSLASQVTAAGFFLYFIHRRHSLAENLFSTPTDIRRARTTGEGHRLIRFIRSRRSFRPVGRRLPRKQRIYSLQRGRTL